MATEPVNPDSNGEAKYPTGNNRGLMQAYELRDLAANAAIAMRDDMTGKDGKLAIRRDEYGKPVDAPAIAQLIKAWSEARDAIRIMRGRGLPKSVPARNEPKQRKARPPVA